MQQICIIYLIRYQFLYLQGRGCRMRLGLLRLQLVYSPHLDYKIEIKISLYR